MPVTYTPITLADLTSATTNGTGVFDVLMRANKAHLEQEFTTGRLKGNEYASVYLGSLQAVLQAALQFTLEKEKQNLDAQIKTQEIELAVQKIALAQAELAISQAKLANIPKEGALLEAQTAKTLKDVLLADKEIEVKEQQVLVATAEVGIAQAKLANIPKEGALLDAQAAKTLKDVSLADKQIDLAAQEILVKAQQVANLASEKTRIEAQAAQITAETLNIPKQGLLIDAQKAVQDQQKINLTAEKLRVDAQATLTTNQAANAVIEGTVLVAQECKLRGEFDKIVAETGMVVDLRAKTAAEKALLDQKRITEANQATATLKQADVLTAQAQAFANDHTVKKQDLRVKAWATARTTDPATPMDLLLWPSGF